MTYFGRKVSANAGAGHWGARAKPALVAGFFYRYTPVPYIYRWMFIRFLSDCVLNFSTQDLEAK